MVEDEVFMTGVRRAGHLTVTPDPRPGGHGAAAGVAGAARTAPQGRADDVRDVSSRGLPEDDRRGGAPGGRPVLGHQGLWEDAGAAEIAELLVQTDSQLGETRPGGQFPAPLGRQRKVITAKGGKRKLIGL